MKNRKFTVIMIVVLVLLVAVLAVIHLNTRQQAQEGALQVVYDGKTVALNIAELKPVTQVEGSVTNNAGVEKQISGQGIAVSDVLRLAGASPDSAVKITSDDEYSASLTAEEIAQEGKAWLLIEEDSLRLVVFGDDGAKRNVKNVVRLTVE